jgi:DNA repair exonuclease SbcCD ATPase subunit
MEKDISDSLSQNTEKGPLSAQINEIDVEIRRLDKQRRELIEKREVQLYALSLLKDSGIKTRIIQTYVPMMNTFINGYMQALNFYAGFELDENFNEVIKSRHHDEFTYANFSDGEKQRIDLAILFTWRQIARVKNNMATNLLFLDEVGDSSMDAEGVDDLVKILYTLKNTNVFVISHKEQMIEKFDRVLTFEKKNHFTTVREAA